jgi:predicted PurR-regulated permease PerM
MDLVEHLRLSGGAIKSWIVAQAQDCLAVGILWWIGLYLIGVPWAWFWALLAGFLQVIPHLGLALGMIGPTLAAVVVWRDWEHPLYVLTLYAGIALVDGFFLQPYLLKRTAKVPMWASILFPIALGLIFSFWGVLLAPPILAIIYAYRARFNEKPLKSLS